MAVKPRVITPALMKEQLMTVDEKLNRMIDADFMLWNYANACAELEELEGVPAHEDAKEQALIDGAIEDAADTRNKLRDKIVLLIAKGMKD